MRRLRMIFLFLGLALLAACQDDSARMAEHLARGDAYFEEERYPEAIIEYKSAQQIDPNHADSHYKLANAFFKSDKLRDGFWELRETVRLDPSNHEAVIEFSQLAILSGESETVLVHLDTLIAENDDVRAHVLRGQALDALKRFEEGRESYQRAVEIDPENEHGLRALARAEGKAGRRDAARATWAKLVEVHPTYANYTLMARSAPRVVEDPEEALEVREQSLLKALEFAEGEERRLAYEQVAAFYVTQERVPEAIAVLENGTEVEEDPVEVLYLLARVHRGQGDAEEADAILERAAEERPEDAGIHRALAAYKSRERDFDGALESVERAVLLDPDEDLAKVQKAEILMELGFRQGREGAVEQARAILVDVFERQPDNVYVLVADAKYQLGMGQPERAVKQLTAVLEKQPNWGEAVYLRGLAFAAQNDFSNSRVELARALEINPNLMGAKASLAEVHFKLGEWQYAVDRAREYLEAYPGDSKVRLLAAQSMVRLGEGDAAARQLEIIPEEERGGEVLFALGRLQQSREDLIGARQYLERANEVLPGNWEILQSLLAIDRVEDRIDESKARILSALESDPENSKLIQLRGLVAFNEGRIDEAESDLRAAVEMSPNDLQGYERLARFYALNGRLEDTTRIYETAIEVEPEAAQIHHFLGVLHELAGDSDRAIERYESAIRYGPGMAEARNNLAYIYADRGEQLDRALDLAQEAKQMLPDNPSVSDTLGWVLFKRGVPAAAVSYLKEAESHTDPNDASIAMIRFHLAQALVASGEEGEAFQAVERALESLNSQMAAAGDAPEEQASAGEPPWAADARAMHAELESQHAKAN